MMVSESGRRGVGERTDVKADDDKDRAKDVEDKEELVVEHSDAADREDHDARESDEHLGQSVSFRMLELER